MSAQITQQDFIDCGWKEILANKKKDGYFSMFRAFSDSATEAKKEGQQTRYEVLRLLCSICSMMLSHESYNDPFKPFYVMNGSRTAIPDDFSDSDTNVLVSVLDFIDNIWLKARIADFLWVKQKPRNIKFLLVAINSYSEVSLDTETWISGGQDCWKRAISLARKSRKNDLVTKIENTVLQSIFVTTVNDGFLCFWLADMLHSNGMGKGHEIEIARKLESLGHEFDKTVELHRSREYYDAAAKWFNKTNDKNNATAMLVALAEAWVKNVDHSSFMSARTFYENAIQVYRSISKINRAVYRVDERIGELKTLMQSAGEKIVGEMGIFNMPGIDISQYVHSARKLVSGKSYMDALLSFANIYPGINIDELYKETEERIKQFPLQALFRDNIFSKDGRLIAKGQSVGLDESDVCNEAVFTKVIREYTLSINLTVEALIYPALEVLILEHPHRESDFIAIVRQSSIIPIDRSVLFGKALFAGFENDFIVAIHLLVPQIENMVRMHLKSIGAKTTTLDKNGIETENGLSTLMDLPETEKLFGKNIAFEIKALFCNPFGPNLRNEIAHGSLLVEYCKKRRAKKMRQNNELISWQ